MTTIPTRNKTAAILAVLALLAVTDTTSNRHALAIPMVAHATGAVAHASTDRMHVVASNGWSAPHVAEHRRASGPLVAIGDDDAGIFDLVEDDLLEDHLAAADNDVAHMLATTLPSSARNRAAHMLATTLPSSARNRAAHLLATTLPSSARNRPPRPTQKLPPAMPMPSVPNPHTSTTRLLPTSSARTASAALSSSSTTHSLPVACPKIDWSRSVPSRVAPYLSAAAYGRSSPAAAGCIITDDDDYDDSNEGANVRVVNGELVPGAHEHADDNDVGLGDHVETSPFAHAAAMTQPRQQQMHTPFADAKQRMRTYKNELDDGFRVMDAATTADTADDAELLFDLELQNLRKTDVSVLSKQLSSRGVGNGGNGHHVASMHAAILSARSLPATAVGATSRAYASTVGATAVPIGSNTRPPRSTATTATDHTFTDIHLHPTTIQSARHPAATAAQVQTVVQQYKRAFHPMLCFLARSMRTVRERVGVLQYRTDVLVVGDGPVHGNTFITYIEEQLADQCSTLNAVSSEITRSPELRAKVLNTFLPFWERRQRAKVVAVEVDARTGVERRVLDVPLTGVDGARQQQQQRGSSEFGLESAMTMSTGSLRATSSDGSFIDVPSPQSSMTGSSGTHARTLLATLRDASTTLMDFARRRTDWETSTIALCQHMVDTLHDAISSSLTSNDGAITSSVGVRTFLVESAQVAVQLTRWIVIGRLAWEREEVRWRMMRLEREQAGVVDMLERAERQLTWGEQE